MASRLHRVQVLFLLAAILLPCAGERWLSPPTMYLLRDLVSNYVERVSEDDSRRAATLRNQ